jgi:hypothetical protein
MLEEMMLEEMMLEEMMLELDSPGSVSTLMIISYLDGAFPGITPDSKPCEAQPGTAYVG